jgi:phospholipase/carboxylesterase
MSASPATTREEVHGGIRFLVLFRGGADENSPLVVGMHGRGGSPERFSRVLQDFSGRAEIALAQAPFKLEQGWSWLPASQHWDDAESTSAFDSVEKKLWQAITELSHGRRVIVTGFSQGGMLSYVLAARHPREIAYAFPVAGGAPPALLPRDRAPTAPVYALHGTSDDVIDISVARSTIAAFQAQGATAELREFAGVGHDMPAALREDLLAHIQAASGAPKP